MSSSALPVFLPNEFSLISLGTKIPGQVRSRNIIRNMAPVARLKSFFAEIDKVENREDLEKLRVKYLDRENGSLPVSPD
jgi:hypothetical protein